MFLYLLFLLPVMVKTKTLAGSCSFKGSTCGYVTDSAFLSWTLNQKDHFISVDTKTPGDQEKAVLLGPDVEYPDWSCIRLVYQLTGGGSLQIYTRSEEESVDVPLWMDNTPSDGWLLASIDLTNSSRTFKMILEGKPGSEEGSSVSILEISITDKYCIDCDFEESHLCGYTNNWNGNVNWYVGGGAAYERSTPGSSPYQGRYMYVDSTHFVTLKEVAMLVSPLTTVPMMGCLSFQYQQDHTEGHRFSLYSRDQSGQYWELWAAEQPESNYVEHNTATQVWIPVQVALSALYPIQLIFEALFNSPKGGRVLIDDVSFSPVPCAEEPRFDPSIANCDFELGLCQYTQKTSESNAWKRASVRPNVYRSGDHTTGRGFFLVANSRLTMQYGKTARLYSPPLTRNQKYCLKFFYSIRGSSQTEQSLVVYLQNPMGTKPENILNLTDNTKEIWIQVQLTIQSPNTTQVVFLSACQNFLNCGSAALDDISLTPGDCERPLGQLLPLPLHCDFENGLCGYTQDKNNIADWVLIRGPTPTSYTGPKGDHTTGFGHYLYIEASHMLPGQNARLVSVPLRGFRGTQCLIFFYHMYGSGTGQLRVLLSSEPDEDTLLWERNGEQSVSWFRASVTYQYDHQHQIVFEAFRGSSVRSDLAIDDITFQKGSCKDAE